MMALTVGVSWQKLGHCRAAAFGGLGDKNGPTASSNPQECFSFVNRSLKQRVGARALRVTLSGKGADVAAMRGRSQSASEAPGSNFFGSNGWRRGLLYTPLPMVKGTIVYRVVRAQVRLDPGGGGPDENGIGRIVFNLAFAGGLTYLTLTGKLGWVFDAIISLWLLAAIVPIVGVVAFLWFAEREIVRGACPNCGNEFQVFEFTVKDGDQRCPFCSQPFKVENKQFVREGPQFSERQQYGGFNPFGFGRRSPDKDTKDPSGVIVDIEAEVKDRD